MWRVCGSVSTWSVIVSGQNNTNNRRGGRFETHVWSVSRGSSEITSSSATNSRHSVCPSPRADLDSSSSKPASRSSPESSRREANDGDRTNSSITIEYTDRTTLSSPRRERRRSPSEGSAKSVGSRSTEVAEVPEWAEQTDKTRDAGQSDERDAEVSLGS